MTQIWKSNIESYENLNGVCSHLNHVLTASSASDSACSEQIQEKFEWLTWLTNWLTKIVSCLLAQNKAIGMKRVQRRAKDFIPADTKKG